MTHKFYQFYPCETPGWQNILKEREQVCCYRLMNVFLLTLAQYLCKWDLKWTYNKLYKVLHNQCTTFPSNWSHHVHQRTNDSVDRQRQTVWQGTLDICPLCIMPDTQLTAGSGFITAEVLGSSSTSISVNSLAFTKRNWFPSPDYVWHEPSSSLSKAMQFCKVTTLL